MAEGRTEEDLVTDRADTAPDTADRRPEDLTVHRRRTDTLTIPRPRPRDIITAALRPLRPEVTDTTVITVIIDITDPARHAARPVRYRLSWRSG